MRLCSGPGAREEGVLDWREDGLQSTGQGDKEDPEEGERSKGRREDRDMIPYGKGHADMAKERSISRKEHQDTIALNQI